MAKTKNRELDTDWDDTVEAPRAGMPDAIKLQRRTRTYRLVVWACIIMFPLSVIGLLSSVERKKTPTAPVVASSATSPGKAVAMIEVNGWLNQTPAPLIQPVTVLSWDGATDVPAVKSTGKGNTAPTFSVEIDHFTVEDGLQRTYNVGVEVAVDPRGGVEAIGGPSISVVTPEANDNWATGNGPWPGLAADTTNISGSLTTAVNSWAAAYASGSTTKLAIAVGDRDGNDTYFPLSGVSGAPVATITAEATVGTTAQDEVIVQVTLAILWNGQKPADPTAGASNEPQTTMDLLVQGANTSAPNVVAWGPPGSGPTLVPYSNAVKGHTPRTLNAGSTPTSISGN